MILRNFGAGILLSLALIVASTAFAPNHHSKSATTIVPSYHFFRLHAQSDDNEGPKYDNIRRNLLIATAVVLKTGTSFLSNASAVTGPSSEVQALLEDLALVQKKLEQIPKLLEAQEWDSVRSILKTPPVNFLWNMGDSKNTLLKLAKATDNFELIELKDDLSLTLQMTDQLVYDNVFVYFQPGNGKINIKEPMELALKAMKQIKDAIEIAKESL